MTKDSLMMFLDACPDDRRVAENGFVPPPDVLLKLAAAGIPVPDGTPTEDEKFSLAMDVLASYGREAAQTSADDSLTDYDEFVKLSQMSNKVLALRAWCRRSAVSDPARKARYEDYCKTFNYGQGLSYRGAENTSCGVCRSGADDYGTFMSKAIDEIGNTASRRDVMSMVSDILATIEAMDENDMLGSAYMVSILKEKAKAVRTAILERGTIAGS